MIVKHSMLCLKTRRYPENLSELGIRLGPYVRSNAQQSTPFITDDGDVQLE